MAQQERQQDQEAGPEANADARNRGARIAVIQKVRASSPEYRKAVTVWMLTAHGIDRMISGFTQPGGGASLRSASKVTVPMTRFRIR